MCPLAGPESLLHAFPACMFEGLGSEPVRGRNWNNRIIAKVWWKNAFMATILQSGGKEWKTLEHQICCTQLDDANVHPSFKGFSIAAACSFWIFSISPSVIRNPNEHTRILLAICLVTWALHFELQPQTLPSHNLLSVPSLSILMSLLVRIGWPLTFDFLRPT